MVDEDDKQTPDCYGQAAAGAARAPSGRPGPPTPPRDVTPRSQLRAPPAPGGSSTRAAEVAPRVGGRPSFVRVLLLFCSGLFGLCHVCAGFSSAAGWIADDRWVEDVRGDRSG